MRKKERYITKGGLGTTFVFVILDGLSQYVELKEEGRPFLGNLDVRRSIKAGACGLILGSSMGYLLYEIHRWEEKDLAFCPDNHLHRVLNEYNIRRDKTFVAQAKKITNSLKEKISFEFGNDLVTKPIDYGSTKTKTAIGGNSDFDILLPFKKKAGVMLDLYEEVYDYLEGVYTHKNYELRKQRHSIGLSYENGNCCIHVDIVLGRVGRNFYETGDVNIIRRGTSLFEKNTYVKSNIWKKRSLLVNQPETRKLIKLMKVYKIHSEVQLNSPVITTLIKEAMKKNNGFINTSIYNNWTLAMGYVADQLLTRVKIKDVANTNNNLLEKMSAKQKDTVVNLICSDLEKLEKSPEYLKEIFEIE